MPIAVPVRRAPDPMNRTHVRSGKSYGCILGPAGEVLAIPPDGFQGHPDYRHWFGGGKWWPVKDSTESYFLACPLNVAEMIYSLRIGTVEGRPAQHFVLKWQMERDDGDQAGSGHSGGGPNAASTDEPPLDRTLYRDYHAGTSGADYAGAGSGNGNGNGNGYGSMQRRAVSVADTPSRTSRPLRHYTSDKTHPPPATVSSSRKAVVSLQPKTTSPARNIPATNRYVAAAPTRPVEQTKRPLAALSLKKVVSRAPTPARLAGFSSSASPAGRGSATSVARAAHVKTGRVTKPSATSRAGALHMRAPASRMAIAGAA